MLHRLGIPGILVTATDTAVGKTLIAAAIGAWFADRGVRVGVCKPVASGCVHRREGLVSEDAEFLAHHADARHPLDVICPVRYAEPLAPAVAAEREHRPMDWLAVQRSLNLIQSDSDVMIVEGVGGVMVPLDDRHTVLDLARWLGLATIVVARPGLGTINHTLLTVDALRTAGVRVAGVVINQYPTDQASVAEETNPRVIERWAKAPILCTVPDVPGVSMVPRLPADIEQAVAMVDWARVAGA